MPTFRSTLSGPCGWSTVVGLTTALTVLVAGQLPTASAAVPELLARSAATATAADEVRKGLGRLPGTFRLVTPAPAAPAAQPVAPPVAQPVVRPAAAVAPAAAAAAAAPPAAAPPAAAPPAAPSLCSGEGWQERRGQAALASLRAGAERTGFRVEFRGARKGYLGLTHLNERRIEMFVRACGTQTDELLRHVMAHELGHAYDTTHLNATVRRAWQVARGIPFSTPWYGCSGCTDFATPAGDFAEVYAQWARGSSTNRSQLAGDVPPAQLAALAQQFFGA